MTSTSVGMAESSPLTTPPKTSASVNWLIELASDGNAHHKVEVEVVNVSTALAQSMPRAIAFELPQHAYRWHGTSITSAGSQPLQDRYRWFDVENCHFVLTFAELPTAIHHENRILTVTEFDQLGPLRRLGPIVIYDLNWKGGGVSFERVIITLSVPELNRGKKWMLRLLQATRWGPEHRITHFGSPASSMESVDIDQDGGKLTYTGKNIVPLGSIAYYSPNWRLMVIVAVIGAFVGLLLNVIADVLPLLAGLLKS
ncbi:MAG: hypothetical protein U0031_10415 [Thermomicrobiales bacterium]